MNRKVYGWKKAALFLCLTAWLCGMTAFADGLSGDNSLSTLGLLVEGATVTPDFVYSTIEYNVTVPAGTQEIVLDPVTSNPAAEIVSITGRELTNGEGTVVITVRAENGSECGYYLYVTSEAAASEPAAQPETETEKKKKKKETQPATEKETEPETEDPRYVRVDRNSLEEAEKTIETLKTETASYRDRLRLLMRILYGLIAFCVVLLFVVINLILKKKDLKAELREYASYGYPSGSGENPFPTEDGGQFQGEDPGEYDGYGDPEDGGYPQEYAPENGGNERGAQEYEDQSGSQQPQPEMQDDPARVPKPSRARRREQKMPEYREPSPTPEYRPSDRKSGKKDVEVTMIDL